MMTTRMMMMMMIRKLSVNAACGSFHLMENSLEI